MDLQPGQNFSITKLSPAPAAVEITLGWEPASTPLTLDSSAFALGGQGKVRGDEDFVFYNQPALPGGGIQRAGDGRAFTVAFAQLPSAIERIVVALTIDQGQRRGQSFGQLSQVRAEVRDAQSKASLATFPLATKMMPETALIVGEFYLRNGEWKFRAVGQGFVGGLGPLARQYGVDVGDDPDATEAAPPAAAAPPPRPAAPISAPAPRTVARRQTHPAGKNHPGQAQSQHFAGEKGPGLRRDRGQSQLESGWRQRQGLFRPVDRRPQGRSRLGLPVQTEGWSGRRGAGVGRHLRQPAPAALHPAHGRRPQRRQRPGRVLAHQRPALERAGSGGAVRDDLRGCAQLGGNRRGGHPSGARPADAGNPDRQSPQRPAHVRPGDAGEPGR
jgi:stress response protein SCP2